MHLYFTCMHNEGVTVLSLDHVQLAMPAGEEERARRFYVGLLGLTEVPKPPELSGRGGCWFETGAVRVHLGIDPDFRPARKAHPALRVDDLTALLRALEAADVAVRPDDPLDGDERAFVEDPFGNRIELIQGLPAPATFSMRPVGVVRGGRVEPTDDHWGAVTATIELDPTRFSGETLAGLDTFSHVEVVYVFDRVDEASVHLGARHPRNRTDWPSVGIFAQRAKARPNRIGVTVCQLLAVHGLHLRVGGLDAIDGTPVLDVKPYLTQFAPRTATRQPAWVDELMTAYW